MGQPMGQLMGPSMGQPIRPASSGHGRELATLAKLYTDEAKYSGENDSFSFKLTIFHDISRRAGVPPEARLKAFPTMLSPLNE
jgi:hypothetical protein